MKLTKVESIVFRFYVFMGKSKSELNKLINRFKRRRIQDKMR